MAALSCRRCCRASPQPTHIYLALPLQPALPCACPHVLLLGCLNISNSTWRCHQTARSNVGCGAQRSAGSCSLSQASDPLHPISGAVLEPRQCLPPTALFIGVAALLATFLLRSREKRSAVREEPDFDAAVRASDDPRHHQRVLAKARQSTHINGAVTYNRAGEFTKAMLELSKALAENSVCRAPAVLAHSKDEMANLYRLHIRYTEQPPNFATLLQLQEMLGLSQEEAEQIELELLHSPGAFAI